ncbi:MAG: PilN domain-containing protein [Thermoanaerobaculia bacterium]|nr:PilN domain-containing protein [Thermoanaerobaculia bacterium]
MPHINLLPWREELRKRRNKEFGVMSFVVAALMAGVVFVVDWHYQQRIDFQESRNAFLEQQIAALDKKIKEIQDLDREKERLLARMRIIQQLQSSRPEIVHVVDAIVKTLPDGVFYTQIQQKGSAINMKGIAQSNARVSSLMRQLEASEWFTDPNLLEIKAVSQPRSTPGEQGSDIKLSNFDLNVTQVEKAKKEAQEAEKSS